MSIKRRIKHALSQSLIFFLAFQLSFFQLFSLVTPQPVSAQQINQASQIDLIDGQLTIDQSLGDDYQLYYQAQDQLQAVKGELLENASIFFGTCSDNECVADEVSRLVLKISNNDQVSTYRYQVSDQLNIIDEYTSLDLDLDEDEQLWLEGSVWTQVDQVFTIDQVELFRVYTAPQNDQLTITFTQLPENPGSLSIQAIQLSEAQVQELGALSSTAYEITSSMTDGSFTYDLTLPNPQPEQEVKVQYSEDGNYFVETPSVKEDGVIKLTGLDHFTVFVVTAPAPAPAGHTIDNGFGAPAFTTDIPWTTDVSHGYDDGTHHYMKNDAAGHWARWTFSDDQLPKSGVNYKIFLHWTVYNNHTNVTYKLYKADGTLKATLATVDQTRDASGADIGNGNLSGAYEVPGSYKIKNGWYVQIETDGASPTKYYSADAIEILTAEKPNKVFVDDDWASYGLGEEVNGTDRVFGYNAFATVQNGIDAVADDGIVKIFKGEYEEQLFIDKSVKIEGVNKDKVFIKSPINLIESFTTTKINYPIVLVENTDDVMISGISIDGLSRGNSNYRFVGLGFYNSSGEANDVVIKNIQDSPLSGSQHGIGFYAYNGDAASRNVALKNSLIYDYQKNGVVFDGGGLNADVIGNTITGSGPLGLGLAAQNGLQISRGATGLIDSNTISANQYIPASWAATGILLYESGAGVQIINNELFDNGPEALYVYASGNNILIKNNNIHDNTGDGLAIFGAAHVNLIVESNVLKSNDYGMWVGDLDSSAKIFNNNFENPTNAADSGSYYWDNGSSIGNRWSDYAGVDINGDGIGEIPYVIDGDSEDRYPLADLLSANVDSVTLSSSFYKEGDEVKIDVQLTNDGEIPLTSSNEQLVVNIKGPSGWISGSFRESRGVDLNVGETTTYSFYSSSQLVPNSWAEGTYKVFTSIYTNRDTSLGYLPGGQSSDTTFVVDNTSPVSPEDITFLSSNGDIDLGCNVATNSYSIIADWSDVGDAAYYEYQSFNPPTGWTWPGGSDGTKVFGVSQRPGAFTRGEGVYGFRVRAVDEAGNKSSWTAADFGSSCQITYDNTNPSSSITHPTDAQGVGNNIVYLNDWDGVLSGEATDDTSPIKAVWLSIQRGNGEYWDDINGLWTASETLFETTWTGTWTYNFLASLGLAEIPEDSYTVRSHAEDMAGNVETTTELEIVVDRTIPEVDISIDPVDPDGDSGWYKTKPTVTLTPVSSDIDYIQFQWNSDSGSWQTYTGPFQIPGEGVYVLYYRAIDLASNPSDTGIKTLKWDETGLNEGPLNVSVSPNPTSATTATVKWDAAQDDIMISKYEIIWSLDDTSTQHSKTVSSSVFETEVDELVEGIWTIKVKAFDGSGHSKEASVKLTVDRSAPDAPVLSLTGTGVGSASLSWNEIEDASQYLIFYGSVSGDYIYGANVGDVTSYTVQGLGAGDYYFIVRAKDSAHNQSPNSNEVSTGTIVGTAGVAPGTPAEGFQPAGEVQGVTTDDTPEVVGEVRGISDELGWWQFNLPWIILVIQAGLVLLIDHLNKKKTGLTKHLLVGIVTVVLVASFYLLVDQVIYTQSTLMSWLAKWFVGVSLILSLLLQAFNYAFIEEVTT